MNNVSAFAKLEENGTVKVSGDALYGGNPSDVVNLKNVKKVYSNKYAFAALTNDGTVYAWGDPMSGGDNSQVIELKNVKEIYAIISAFAALRNDGTVYAWGNVNNAEFVNIKNVISISTTDFSFIVETKDGVIEIGNTKDIDYDCDIRVSDINTSNEMLEDKLENILSKKVSINLSTLVDATSKEYMNQRKGIYYLRELFYTMHISNRDRERFAHFINWLHKTNYMIPVNKIDENKYYSMQGNFEVFNFTYTAFFCLLIYRFNHEKTTPKGFEFLKQTFNNGREYLSKLLSRTHQNGRIEDFVFPGTTNTCYTENNAYLLSEIPELMRLILSNPKNKSEIYTLRNRVLTLMLENFHDGFVLSENIKKKSIILYNNYYMSFLFSILIIFKNCNIIFPFEYFKTRIGSVINRLKKLISDSQEVRHKVLLEYAKFYSQFDSNIDINGYDSMYEPAKTPSSGKYFLNDIKYECQRTLNKFRVVIALYDYLFNDANIPDIELEEAFVNVKHLIKALRMWDFKTDENCNSETETLKILNLAQNKLKLVKSSKGKLDKINFN